MTEREKIIVSAYTGYLLCDFSKVHKYIEEKLGRSVWTHELVDEKIQKEIREKCCDDFIECLRGEEQMSGDMMIFPTTWEEFERDYGFTDTEHIYTNGSRLMQSFRVEQWLEHIKASRPKGKWIKDRYCSSCEWDKSDFDYTSGWRGNFCPNCGADMRGKYDE